MSNQYVTHSVIHLLSTKLLAVLYMCEIERRRKKGNEEEQRRGGEGRKECRGNVGAGRIGIHEKDREIYIF